jgi:hypothetical protein
LFIAFLSILQIIHPVPGPRRLFSALFVYLIIIPLRLPALCETTGQAVCILSIVRTVKIIKIVRLAQDRQDP